MWGQDWENITDIVLPPVAPGTEGVDLTALLKARKASPVEMFRMGERFYTSLGFDSLRRRSGNGPCSTGRATGTSCATRARGTSTT